MLVPIFRRPSIGRLRVLPDDPIAIVGRRPRGSRRPHTDATVAAVRNLVEQTTLTYAEIAKRAGVACASICRWTRDGGWQRPLFAPRATDTVPSARASARLKLRTLAARLSAVAERYVRELEDTPAVDLDKLAQALELLKMARLTARTRRGHRRPANDSAGASLNSMSESARARVIEDLRGSGVDIASAPPSAVAISSRATSRRASAATTLRSASAAAIPNATAIMRGCLSRFDS